MRGFTSETIFFAIACGLSACNTGDRVKRAVAGLDAGQSRIAATATPAPSTASPDGGGEWEQLRLEDDQLPLCVFSDHLARGEALFLQDVHKQTLHAGSSVVFGAFPPGCQNERCDSAPTLQCWVVVGAEPNTIVVHSRLSFGHKRGAVCTKDCRPVVAGCETDVLKAGKYTVKYGERTFGFSVPSALRDPCFVR
jgi:hypothetical protein